MVGKQSSLVSALLSLGRTAAPFTAEGPQFYAAAHRQNAPFAKPSPTFVPYQTTLDPLKELLFRAWLERNHVPFNPNAQTTDYDMRGYYQASGGVPHTPGQHFPDTFKTPYDTSFSAESKYATANNPYVWRGDQLVDRRTGRVVFSSLR